MRVSLIIQEQELSGCNKGEASKSVNKFQEGTWCYNPDGIEINYHDCKMVAIYANPEHVHFFVSRAPRMDEERLADLVAMASSHFIHENKLCIGNFGYRIPVQHFLFQKEMLIKYVNIF